MQGSGFVYHAADGSTVPVQPIPGLEVRIVNGRAIYYALASNLYGLETGSYAGEFRPLVTVGQADGSSAETGGIVLAGPVVAKLTTDKLDSLPSGVNRWVVALPVDIRDAGTSVIDVSFDRFGLVGSSNTPRVVVRYPGSMPIVETIPTNGGFHVLVEELGATAWQVIDPVRLGLATGAIDPEHAMNQLLIYGDGAPSLNGTPIKRDILLDRPVAVGSLIMSATNDVSVSLVVNGSRSDLDPSDLLSIADVPIFVTSS